MASGCCVGQHSHSELALLPTHTNEEEKQSCPEGSGRVSSGPWGKSGADLWWAEVGDLEAFSDSLSGSLSLGSMPSPMALLGQLGFPLPPAAVGGHRSGSPSTGFILAERTFTLNRNSAVLSPLSSICSPISFWIFSPLDMICTLDDRDFFMVVLRVMMCIFPARQSLGDADTCFTGPKRHCHSYVRYPRSLKVGKRNLKTTTRNEALGQ